MVYFGEDVVKIVRLEAEYSLFKFFVPHETIKKNILQICVFRLINKYYGVNHATNQGL